MRACPISCNTFHGSFCTRSADDLSRSIVKDQRLERGPFDNQMQWLDLKDVVLSNLECLSLTVKRSLHCFDSNAIFLSINTTENNCSPSTIYLVCIWAVIWVIPVQHWHTMLGSSGKLSFLAREGAPVYWKITTFCKMVRVIKSNKLKAWDAEVAGRLVILRSIYIITWSCQVLIWDMWHGMIYSSDYQGKAADKGVSKE